jgi:hypothetical protein
MNKPIFNRRANSLRFAVHAGTAGILPACDCPQWRPCGVRGVPRLCEPCFGRVVRHRVSRLRWTFDANRTAAILPACSNVRSTRWHTGTGHCSHHGSQRRNVIGTAAGGARPTQVRPFVATWRRRYFATSQRRYDPGTPGSRHVNYEKLTDRRDKPHTGSTRTAAWALTPTPCPWERKVASGGCSPFARLLICRETRNA